MQSWMALLVTGMLIGPLTGATVASADTSSVPAETQSVVDTAFAEWQDGLGVRRECSSGVTFVFEELSGRRGEYRTGSAVVVIDPSDDVDGMGSIVVHELSHHTFLSCGVFADVEFAAAFYAAQGIPADRDWFDYSAGWGATPAEHFAEAMAVTISGRGEGGIAVGAETQALVARWLSGAPPAPPEADTYEPVPYSPNSIAVASTEDGGRTNSPKTLNPRVEVEATPTGLVAAAAEIVEYTKVLLLHSWRVV